VSTVLVVDDDADIRDVIRINLAAEGYRVVAAGDGEEALRLAQRSRPDAIFLDVLMPGLDGWGTLARLKRPGSHLADVPVFMLTALGEPQDRLRGGIEGAIRYLTKPFQPRDLVAVLDDLFGPETEPEPAVRGRVRRDALAALARMEAGRAALEPADARVHLTRLEREAVPTPRRWDVEQAQARVALLTPRQREMLVLVRDHESVAATAAALGVGRSTVYTALRRIARRLGLRDAGELRRLLAAGALLER
jgi:DNA-binding response OmpR family regulator